ncbi:biotin synthetase [Halobacteroides halobius DSM 5150]|uniref:Biotin synthase n=1 Tax=Halobacteroides halobius (strain ATCC 35273 / DSM 5150 / MD-1) TaxID=748449 RepID=L0K509_HALHC|nr:biotin synthase BioB [Halobacteroides halobius]AGB40337.1 biotin synthetase [Halobacteroides halobius DSM 5150]
MLTKLKKKVLAGEKITKEEAIKLVELEESRTMELLAAANQIKNQFIGKKVDLCSIVNAKSGSCSEDCTFCAQSIHYDTGVSSYDLLDRKDILARAKEIGDSGAEHFGIVTSGRGVVSDQEFEQILETMKTIKEETELEVCASLGTLDQKRVEKLSGIGLKRYNHNLETSKSHFPEVCTTHSYEDRVKTVRFLKDRDIEVCCGGIIGLGEDFADRVELAFTLRELDVDSVPINILNPVAGTPVEDNESVPPREVLKTAAIFRFTLPNKVIKLCGGREDNLRDLQSLSLLSGINGLLTGNYLTTEGRAVEEDIQMIHDLGLTEE